ncbi:hypothetical protein QUB80_05415 [Chlorogloeopsis sp. ULAP01]|uniref:hypothetical protein n=1 Tax=Chlorogloeopsis sp. ULAP01 TaxID=3056483 RepID=UPI0025AB17E8|nr:hypothetical protein [Chlorogloeopsis sp. ULAP01]MDM9380137.1 hypothetical protein [Chlorogloeopsis sp. ULAP01]
MFSHSLARLLSLSTLISALTVCQSAGAITRIGNAQFIQKQALGNSLKASKGVTFPYQNSSHQPDTLLFAYKEQAAQKIIITTGSVPKGDSFSLSNSRIIGKQLKIDVSYGGGCKQHNFNLYWNGAYQESFPPQVRMRLVHDANKDTCKKLVKKTLVFDIQSLQSSIIRLTTNFGDSTSIDYTK